VKLPGQIYIDPAKVRDYLLVFKEENDKSQFFGYGGYVRENWGELFEDIYEASSLDAEPVGKARFGNAIEYNQDVILPGRNGTKLIVSLKWHYDGEQSRLITVIPQGVRK